MVALAVALAAGTASATTIDLGGYVGPIMMKYGNFDVGRVYAPGVITPVLPGPVGGPVVDGVPSAPPGGIPLVGSTDPFEDFWGIAKVTEIYAGTDVTAPVIYSAAPGGPQSGIQVTAIFWGGRDIQVIDNPLSGTQDIWSDSIKMSVFASVVGNNADGLNFVNAGPGARVDAPVGPGAVPNYAGVTDGTLVWTFNGIPGVSAANPFAEFHSQYNPTLLAQSPVGFVVGGGGLYLDVGPNPMGVGAQNNQIAPNANGADATVQFTVRVGGNGWLTHSDDPLLTTAVPLPSSVYMGFAGLVALAFGAYRRQRAA
jgi:hypothetical protein